MSFATEGFSAMMSFLVTGKKRLRKNSRQDSRSSLREAQNDKCNRNVKQETVARRPSPSRDFGSVLVRPAFLAVGYQLVEDQGVYIAAARPKHHQDDHLELVQTHDFVG